MREYLKFAAAAGLGLSILPSSALAQEAGSAPAEAAPAADEQLAVVGVERFGTQRRPELEDEEQAGEFEIEFVLAGLTDFRERGVSETDGDPAAQFELSVEHKSGLFASVEGTTVREDGTRRLELESALGFSFPIGSVTADLAIVDKVVVGVSGTNHIELEGALSRQFGPLELAAAVSYTPRQDNTGNADNIYTALEFSLPVGKTPLTVSGAVGYEKEEGEPHKFDWELGLAYDFEVFEVGVAYIDTAHTFGEPGTGATVVASLVKRF